MADDSVLIEQPHALRVTSLALTALTDDATLDYQIARVPQGHSERREHVVPKLVALHRLAQLDMCVGDAVDASVADDGARVDCQ
jgi:hypothetical protein